jgi:hypothetical protein
VDLKVGIRTFFYRIRFFEYWSIFDLDVEEVQFLVPLGDFAVFIDPEQGVLYFFAVRRRFVYAYVNGEFVGFGGGLKAEYEGRRGYWTAEGDCARGVGCYALERHRVSAFLQREVDY